MAQDAAAGADKYVALRRQWGAHVVAFAEYMAYAWAEIAVQETDPQRETS